MLGFTNENIKTYSLRVLKYFFIFSITFSILTLSLKAVYAHFTLENKGDGISISVNKDTDVLTEKNLVTTNNQTKSIDVPLASKPQTKTLTDSYIQKQNTEEFFAELGFNEYLNLFFITGNNGYSYTAYPPVAREFSESKIDKKTVSKLIELTSIFNSKSEKFKVKLPDRDQYVSHVGISFKKGDKLSFTNTLLGDTDLTLPENINFEISKIGFAEGKVYLGMANTFAGNGRTFGDIFLKIDVDTAISKFKNAFLANVLITDVQYPWDKTMNIIVGAQYAQNFTNIKGLVDINDILGFPIAGSVGYVPGAAIIGGQNVDGVLAGGVCHWATVWSTAVRMGLDGNGVKYKVLKQDQHTDIAARYIPNTVYPYLNENIFHYDVTVAYLDPNNIVGTVLQLEEGKSLDIKITPLIEDASNARFFAVIETNVSK